MKRLSILLLTVILAVTAQFSASAQEAYQFRHLLETGLGWTGSTAPLVGVNADAKAALINAVGANVRYNFFFHDNWGVYGGLSLDENMISRESYLSAVQSRNSTPYGYKPFYAKCSSDVGPETMGMSAGIVSRYAWGRFSIMPRLGIGYGRYSFRDFRYWRYDDAECSGRPMLVCRTYEDGSDRKNALDLHAGIQFNYSISPRVFLFLEGSITGSPNRVGYEDYCCYAVEKKDENVLGPLLEVVVLTILTRGKYSSDIEASPWKQGPSTGVILNCSRPIGCRYNARAGVGVYLGRRAK